MRALFHRLALDDHHDPVGVAHGREAVRDDQRRAPFGKVRERLRHLCLGGGVERRRGLVEKQDRRVAQHRAGDRHTLALPARQRRAARAGGRFEAKRHRVGELGHMGDLKGLGQCRLADVGATQKHVFADRLVKECRVLCHHREHVAQRAEIERRDRHAAHGDRAAVRIDEPGEQVEDGGLAGTRGADEGGGLARFGGEAEPAQHRLAAIAQPHVVEPHLGRRRARGRLRRRADLGGDVEDAIEPFEAGGGGLPGAGKPAKPAQRLEGQRHRGEEGHELADGALALDDLGAAEHEDGEETKPGHHIDQRRDHRLRHRHLHHGAADEGHQRLEAAQLVGFHPVQLDRRDAVEHLVEAGGAGAGLIAHLPRLLADVALRHGGGQHQKRRADQRGECPARVDRQRHAEERDERDRIAPGAGDEGGPDPLHGKRVALHPLDQRAGRVRLEKGLVEGQDVAHQIDLHVRGGALRHVRQQRPRADRGDGADQEQPEDRAAHPPDHPGLALHEDGVEQRLQHCAERAEGRALDDHQHHGDHHLRPVPAQVAVPHPGKECVRTIGGVGPCHGNLAEGAGGRGVSPI
ncbi:hypothetical protein SDC9_21375 [bioreactor metagenome]|uniref:Uncharacterized protein n=1 Tax=bioreactor metagenome TaxID=1076179 RepID=A0A644U9D2_9ZZZZ